MNIDQLQDFFLWCLLINTGIYALTAIALVVLSEFLNAVHKKVFGMDEEAVGRSVQNYLGGYKLLITVFNFTPWIALLIIE